MAGKLHSGIGLRMALLGAGLLAATSAAAIPGLDLPMEHAVPQMGAREGSRATSQSGLMRQWIPVGKCVVRRDRHTSLEWLRAPIGSDIASAAAQRLDPIFADCLAGSRVPGPSSLVLRRAALANALGVSLTRA